VAYSKSKSGHVLTLEEGEQEGPAGNSRKKLEGIEAQKKKEGRKKGKRKIKFGGNQAGGLKSVGALFSDAERGT